MIEKEDKGTRWLEFETLQEFPHLFHVVTFSETGLLHPFFEARFQEKEIPLHGKLIELDQCHSGDVVEITEANGHYKHSADAVMTDLKHHFLHIKHADCQAAIIYDPIKQKLATVHSGWRGSVANIYSKTIDAMKIQYNSKPEDLIVCIGPSLGPQSAEFIHYENELPQTFWSFQSRPTYFDFWEISRWQLVEAGVLDHHLEIAKLDTFSDSRFYSYRRNKTQTRHLTVAALI